MTMFAFSKSVFPSIGKRVDNAAMPQSTKERQESLRAKRAMLGLTEVRGIYAPPNLHAAIKEAAQKLMTKRQA